jgi:hypothetical protein
MSGEPSLRRPRKSVSGAYTESAAPTRSSLDDVGRLDSSEVRSPILSVGEHGVPSKKTFASVRAASQNCPLDTATMLVATSGRSSKGRAAWDADRRIPVRLPEE